MFPTSMCSFLFCKKNVKKEGDPGLIARCHQWEEAVRRECYF